MEITLIGIDMLEDGSLEIWISGLGILIGILFAAILSSNINIQ